MLQSGQQLNENAVVVQQLQLHNVAGLVHAWVLVCCS